MRLYIIRHADPDYARNCLTELGHREARELAERVGGDEGFTHLYTSPLPRAAETAGYVERATGLRAEVLPWTAELSDLVVEGAPADVRMAWDQPGEGLRGKPGLFSREGWCGEEPFAGPHYRRIWNEVRAGSDALLARHGYVREGHTYRIERPTRDRVAVFCHKGLGLTWLAHLLDLPVPFVWSGFWLAPASVTCLVLDERCEHVAVPRTLWLNDTRHLWAAGLAANPHGIKGNFE